MGGSSSTPAVGGDGRRPPVVWPVPPERGMPHRSGIHGEPPDDGTDSGCGEDATVHERRTFIASARSVCSTAPGTLTRRRPSSHSAGVSRTWRAGRRSRSGAGRERIAVFRQRENPAVHRVNESLCDSFAHQNRSAILRTLTRREASRSHLAGTEFLRTHRKSKISETPEIFDFWGR